MYEYCKSCVHDKGDIGFCDKCGYTYMLRKRGLPPTEYEAKSKPPSNADRIRAMTDEELAAFFAQQEYRKPGFDGWLPLCNHVMGPRTCHENGCEKCWLDWLKQEAEDDNHDY